MFVYHVRVFMYRAQCQDARVPGSVAEIKTTFCRIDLGNPDLSHIQKYEPASWRCVLSKSTAVETAPGVPIGAEVRPSTDVRIITL